MPHRRKVNAIAIAHTNLCAHAMVTSSFLVAFSVLFLFH